MSSASTQPQESGFPLPVGYTLQGYKINQIISEDEYSVSYFATEGTQDTDIILVEYLPRSLSQRNQNTYSVTPLTAQSKQEFEWGLSEYRAETYDLIEINHPNIINVKSYFEAHNTAYKVIDTTDGITLEQFTKDKLLSESEVLSLIEPLLDGLEVIHASGHIHSDLTPSSILIQNEISEPVITHLGDASHIFRHHEKEIPLMVSPGYSPCEHYYANDKQGAWTDIYALGCILYKLVTGITPSSAASRITGIADHNKDPLIPASKIVQKKGAHTYSKQFLSAIDHATQLQRRDRPQTVNEWRNDLGIQNNITVEVAVEVDDTDLITPSNLSISGVSTTPDDFSTSKELAIDFESLIQASSNENSSKLKQFALMATFASAILASLVGSYHYLTQLTQSETTHTQDELTKTHDTHALNSQKTVIAQLPAPDDFPQTVTTDTSVELQYTPAQEELALKPTTDSSSEELLVIPSLEAPPPEKDLPIPESTIGTPTAYIEEVELKEELTPLWLLDVPLTKDEQSLQQFEDTYIANEIITLPIILRYANEVDAEIERPEVTTLTNLISTHHEIPITIATPIFSEQISEQTIARQQSASTKEVASNNISKATNVVRNNSQKKPVTHSRPPHHSNHSRNTKSRKTRQQYQQEWAAEQRRKKSRNKTKTKQQYQKEWTAKQNQIKKRAEWKKKKEHMKRVKTRETVQQIEKGLLDDQEW